MNESGYERRYPLLAVECCPRRSGGALPRSHSLAWPMGTPHRVVAIKKVGGSPRRTSRPSLIVVQERNAHPAT